MSWFIAINPKQRRFGAKGDPSIVSSKSAMAIAYARAIPQ